MVTYTSEKAGISLTLIGNRNHFRMAGLLKKWKMGKSLAFSGLVFLGYYVRRERLCFKTFSTPLVESNVTGWAEEEIRSSLGILHNFSSKLKYNPKESVISFIQKTREVTM